MWLVIGFAAVLAAAFVLALTFLPRTEREPTAITAHIIRGGDVFVSCEHDEALEDLGLRYVVDSAAPLQGHEIHVRVDNENATYSHHIGSYPSPKETKAFTTRATFRTWMRQYLGLTGSKTRECEAADVVAGFAAETKDVPGRACFRHKRAGAIIEMLRGHGFRLRRDNSYYGTDQTTAQGRFEALIAMIRRFR
jgi:hypothetical protein